MPMPPDGPVPTPHPREQLRLARLRLMAADKVLASLVASNSWQLTEPFRHFAARFPRAGRIATQLAKIAVFAVSGTLLREVRYRRQSRAAPRPPVHRVEAAPGDWMPPPPPPGPAGRVILVADMSVPKPDQHAGARTTRAILDVLLAAGWRVVFWPHDRSVAGLVSDAAEKPYVDALAERGVLILDARRQGRLGAWLARHGHALDHIMLMRPFIAKDLLPDILDTCRATLSYYGHDLHYARMEQQAAFSGDLLMQVEARKSLETERGIWRLMDVVLYPAREEVEAVRALEPLVTAAVLPPYCFTTFATPPAAPPAQPAVLFVGGFLHQPNVDAVLWFVRAIFPLIRQRRPDARFVVAGGGATPEVAALAGDGVDLRGQVSDAELARLYAAARVVAVPLRYGAGVKGKVVEALQSAAPIVTTSVGAQGLDGVSAFVPVADEPAAFAGAVLGLLGDDAAWGAQAAAQVAYARAHFSFATMQRCLLEALEPG